MMTVYRLVKVIVRKREECGRISWWGEYDQLLRKYGLDDNERGSAQRRTVRYSSIAIRSALKRLSSSLKRFSRPHKVTTLFQ